MFSQIQLLLMCFIKLSNCTGKLEIQRNQFDKLTIKMDSMIEEQISINEIFSRYIRENC